MSSNLCDAGRSGSFKQQCPYQTRPLHAAAIWQRSWYECEGQAQGRTSRIIVDAAHIHALIKRYVL